MVDRMCEAFIIVSKMISGQNESTDILWHD